MLLAYVYLVITMFILPMPYLGVIQELLYMNGAILSLQQLGVWKRRSHSVKTATGLHMLPLLQPQAINNSQSIVILDALLQPSFQVFGSSFHRVIQAAILK
ncbi:Zinc finger protein CONSTANS-LIKE 10 [Olea europaea subsp. europaea]|uniref:Zinc finger protein CONSTANS-LIKE 10 n=1 Tax=Olea europaea subsp. europaea TaxID=158383 RepID=A0A8S0TEY9_OLEEU|nr:Zinc finger protein CONSTANS-LIKE 10 [Olea europaea subsp. europaea]